MIAGRPRAWRPSLRLRLTAVFAGAMALLLAGLGLFVYSSFQTGLNRSLDQGLAARANDVRALVMQADSGLSSAGGGALTSAARGFAQVLRHDGRVLDATPGIASRSLLSQSQLARAHVGATLVGSQAIGAGVDARLLAVPVTAQGQRLIVVVGSDLRDHAAALADLRALLLLGGPIALLIASALGYALSALALRSVERMRRRAHALSVTEPGHRLPVPRTGDELSRLATTLNEMHVRNEAAYERQRRFVADASHELRAPLAVLRAELEVALTGPASVRALRSASASALEEADHLARLTQDLLTLAQVDDGRLSLELEDVSVVDAFARAKRRFDQRCRAEHRDLVASAPDDLFVRADSLRVDQVLANLVDNALRHGAGTVVLSASRDGDRVELHVADDGAGFDEKFLPAAFERFTQPDEGRARDGAGLGLAIVLSVARAHGGDAHAINRPGGGADAWIELPRAAVRSARSAPDRGPSRGGAEPLRTMGRPAAASNR
jgi:signal transduction histidine kinase